MKRLLAIVVLGLLMSGNSFAEIVKSIHGFSYKLPANYKLVNNINIEDLKKLPATDGVKGLMDAYGKQMQTMKLEYLFYKDWGGDNIGLTTVQAKDGVVDATNIKSFCDQQLKILENAAKEKLEGYNCDLSKYPKGSSWAVYSSYVNPFTKYPTSIFQVEFTNKLYKGKRFIVGLVCGPKYCVKLVDDLFNVVESISFEEK